MFNLDIIHDVRELVKSCEMCSLYENGRAIPFVGSNPKAIILGEAPGKDEVEQGVPFVGKSGQTLFDTFAEFGFTRNDFIIINTTQCRPIKKTNKGISNGKPSKPQIKCCMPFVTSTIFCSGIDHVIGMGNYPKYWIDLVRGADPKLAGIGKVVGDTIEIDLPLPGYNPITFTYCYHPASIIYDKNKKEKFENTIAEFSSLLIPF